MKMVTISETRHSTVDTDQEHGSDTGHSSDSSPRLLPCHLIQLSPESAGNNSFHQITRWTTLPEWRLLEILEISFQCINRPFAIKK